MPPPTTIPKGIVFSSSSPAVVRLLTPFRCCWTSRMEQSANPAAIVGHYTRTISTSTQNASIWSLTAAASSESVFRALCTNLLACLLTYLLIYFV